MISFTKPEDFKQLEGFMIHELGIVMTGVTPVLTMILSRLGDPGPGLGMTKIRLVITPTVTLGLAGNVMLANPGLNLTSSEEK